jgi:hypothetical protein
MSSHSEPYCRFPCLSYLPAFSLEPFPFSDEQLDAAGLRGEGESLSHFAHLSHIYHLRRRRFRERHTGNEDDDGAPRTPRRRVP